MFNFIRNFNLIFVFLMGLLIAPFVVTVGPIIERNNLPVVSRAVITKVQYHGTEPEIEDAIDFWVKARKLRECSYDHIEWFYGDPNGAHARLTLEFKDKGAVLPAGEDFEFGPLRVYINEVQLKTNTFAVLFHRCHPFWLSQSIFYP